jgi:hypothetical protein
MNRDLDEIEMELKGAEMDFPVKCSRPEGKCSYEPTIKWCGTCAWRIPVERERVWGICTAGVPCTSINGRPRPNREDCRIGCHHWQLSDPSWAQRAGMPERAEVRGWIVVCNGTHELGVAYKDAMPGRDHRQWMTEDEARAKVSEWDGLYKGVPYRAFKWSDGVQG